MDPIAIILTIAACIGGLILLYFIIALIVTTIFAKKARQTFEAFDEDFFNRPGSHFRR
ncbi:hypothetical protein AB0N33_00895 [Pseudarthrobacter oxydans]|uniref:hypothetical protein n=1 Tax=Pseudarthrobacter oxydans TaxID=1671 RepID=UPI00343269E9